MKNHEFETGAKTAAANNLVLSVMNDGAVYRDRMHAGYAMLQGAHHIVSFRELAQCEAAKQRKNGSKFPAASITDAARIIQDQTISACLETIFSEWDGSTIICEGRKWWDSTNGNSYFSASIRVPTKSSSRLVSIPFSYGYDSHWEFECMRALKTMGFTFPENVARSSLPVSFNNAVYTQKRNMFNGIYFLKG